MADSTSNTNNFTKSAGLGLTNGAGIIANMEVGGQLGYGIKAGALDAATPLVLPPAVIYVTQTPHMWDVNENGQALARVVKSLFETHAKSVTGIDIGYTLESGQQPVGHDGQQMDAPTVSKRNAVQPNFTWGEVTGNLVFRCIQTWLWDIADPDTQISLARLQNVQGAYQVMPFTMSTYALSFMALQFDQTMAAERLLGAIYITNVYPTATNEFGIKREIGQAAVQDRSISFTGLAIENENIYALGKEIAQYLTLRSAAYFNPMDPYSEFSGWGENSTIAGGIAGIKPDTGSATEGDGDMTGLGFKSGGVFTNKSPKGAGDGSDV